jgi:macrolide-specific efflux system membrane fusion protein
VQAQLDTANANLNAAKAAYTRAKNANSDSATLSSASAQVTSAESEVTSAQEAVDGTVLTAPIAGTVTAVSGAVGSSSGSSSSSSSSSSGSNGGTGSTSSSSSSSSSSSGFVSIADLSHMQVNASFAEADATKLKTDQVVNITWSIDTLPTGVRIGQSVSVVVTIAEKQNVLRVPTQAVRSVGNTHTVQVASTTGGAPETRVVQVGVQGNSYVEVTSGLQEGDKVVITIATSSSTGTGQTGNFPGGGGNIPGGGGGNIPGGGGRGGN